MNIIFKHSLSLASSLLVVLCSNAVAQSLADVSAGKQRAAVCFACHGENGVSKIPGTPHLAGQDRPYLEKALRAYKSGSRQDPSMSAMAQPLSDSDIVNIAAYFNLAIKDARGQMLSEAMATQERIRPVARLVTEETPAYKASSTDANLQSSDSAIVSAKIRSGKEIYTAHCLACHSTGVAGAPKLGDKAAWKVRLGQGESALIASAMKGKGAMPPKGTCTDCSEDDLKRAIDYLLSEN
jgi:cytochrome c5